MNAKGLRSREDAIFEKYSRRHPRKGILRDGAADPEAWLAADNFRVLFMLKEGNDPTGNFNELRDFAADGGRYATWANLACWAATARRSSFEMSSRRDAAWRGAQLRHSAFVNLKKVPGGSRSDDREIRRFAVEHADLLRAQLTLYKPHLTLACGNGIFAILEEVVGGQRDHPINHHDEVVHGFTFLKSPTLGTVIDFFHPQARTSGGAETFLEMLRPNLRYHFPKRFM